MNRAGQTENPSSFPFHDIASVWTPDKPAIKAIDLKPCCDAGVTSAVLNALELGIEDGTVPDNWLIRAAMNQIAIALMNEVKCASKKGTLLKGKMKDYYRWRAVAAFITSGMTKVEATVRASEDLRGTFCFGSPASMKYSYDKIRSILRDPAKSVHYYSSQKTTRKLTDTELVLPANARAKKQTK